MKPLSHFVAGLVLCAFATLFAVGTSLPASPRPAPVGAARPAAAETTTLRVFASNAVRTTMQQLLSPCERAVHRALLIDFDPSSAISKSIEAGAPFDVVIGSSDLLATLAAEGKLVPGSTAPIARSAVGVGIRAGSPRPDLSSPEGMKRALLSAKAIAYTKAGASEPLILKMADRLGISDQVKAKTLAEPTTAAAGADVLAGRADLLLTMTSEILPIKGLKLAGPIPAAFDRYLTFSGGVGAKSSDPEASAAVIRFLTAPSVAAVIKSKGMEPAQKPRDK